MSRRSRQILRFLAPVRDQQDDFISGTYGGNGILKLAGCFDVLVVDGKDNIIEPDAHFFRRTVFDHFGDKNNRPPSIFHVHDPHIFSRDRLNGYAKPGLVCRGCRRCRRCLNPRGRADIGSGNNHCGPVNRHGSASPCAHPVL